MAGNMDASLRRLLAAWAEHERAELREMRRGASAGHWWGSKKGVGRVGGHHGREICHTRFKGQSRVHLIHAPKKTTYIITECIEINVTI
jgi:hypothetical protein